MIDDSNPEDELVVAASFASPHEVQFAKGLLESHSIDVFLGDENTTRMGPYLTFFSGIKLMVRRSDLPHALELLESADAGETQTPDEDVDA